MQLPVGVFRARDKISHHCLENYTQVGAQSEHCKPSSFRELYTSWSTIRTLQTIIVFRSIHKLEHNQNTANHHRLENYTQVGAQSEHCKPSLFIDLYTSWSTIWMFYKEENVWHSLSLKKKKSLFLNGWSIPFHPSPERKQTTTKIRWCFSVLPS